MKNIKKWLYLQKEGILIGGLWGLLSIYASMGLAATNQSLAIWQKILLMPVWLTDLFLDNQLPGLWVLVIPIVLAAVLGAIADSIYKPRE